MPLRPKHHFEERLLRLTETLKRSESRGKGVTSTSVTPSGKKVVHIVTRRLYDDLIFSFRHETTFGDLLSLCFSDKSNEEYDLWVAHIKQRLKPDEIIQLKKDLGFLKAKVLEALDTIRGNFHYQNIKSDLLANALYSIYAHFDLLNIDL